MANILIYNINEPYVHQGGMERVTDSLIRLLQQRGHRVSVLCRYRNRMNAHYICPCEIFYLPENRDSAAYYEQLLDRLKPDIIIDQEEGGIIGAHGFFHSRSQLRHNGALYIAVQHSSALSALRNYKQLRHKEIPNALLSMLYHGPVLTLMQQRAWRLKQRDYRQLVRNYDCIVTLSESAIRDFRELCPAGGRITAIANSSHYPQPVRIPPKKNRLLFVGRMENFSKGINRLIRIWAALEKSFPDWELHLLGDGPDLEKNRQLAEHLLLERCVFHGCCDPEPFYREASFICLTSGFEGFGMVLLEGMQYGCIPIAFDSYPAVHDLIEHRINGMLVPPFDEPGYARVLSLLMQHEPLRQKMHLAAWQKSLRFSPEIIGRQWQQLISDILTEQAS